MNPRWAGGWVAVAILIVTLAGLWLFRKPLDSRREVRESALPPPAAAVLPELHAETWMARLYFPTANDQLMAQETPVTSASGARARATGVVAALLAGAPAAPRVPVFPIEVKLGRLLLLSDGTVIVDLRTDPIAEPPQSGSTLEQLRIYAIVNSVLRNVEEAKRVVLLWNGVQRPSLAGHVDTRNPLRLRADLEAS
jgi:hypothetical protein